VAKKADTSSGNRREALREALDREAAALSEAAGKALLDRTLAELIDPAALAGAIQSVLASERLLPAVRKAARAELDRELDRWPASEQTLGQRLSAQSTERLRTLLGDPTWFSGAWIRDLAANETLEQVMGATLYEVLREFSLTVNPFFSSWGLPALLKKAGPLAKLGMFGINLESGSRVLESMREEFERQLEPHIKSFLQKSAKAALLRAVTLAQSPANLSAFAQARVRMLDRALETRLAQLAEKLDRRRLDEVEEALAGLQADLLAELRKTDLEARLRELLERRGQHTVEQELRELGLDPQQMCRAASAAWLPMVRAVLASEPVVDALERVYARFAAD
jgi:hypothetical protein